MKSAPKGKGAGRALTSLAGSSSDATSALALSHLDSSGFPGAAPKPRGQALPAQGSCRPVFVFLHFHWLPKLSHFVKEQTGIVSDPCITEPCLSV